MRCTPGVPQLAKKHLTDLVVKQLKPPKTGRIELGDTQVPGLQLRCTAKGTKSFAIIYGPKRNRKRKTLGKYPILSLAEAREMARDFLHDVSVAPRKVQSPSFDEAVERFLVLKEPVVRRPTFREYKRLLSRHFKFETTQVEDISPQQVMNAIDAISAPSERTHAYTAAKTFFNWCLEREYCVRNPLEKMKKPKVVSNNDRVLDIAELEHIWHAAFTMKRYGPLVRAAIVTGQRVGQLASMHENWIDKDHYVINFPAWAMKNKQPHMIPIGSLFLTAISLNKPVDGWLFSPPNMPGVPFSAWSKSKKELDAKLPPMEPWVLHDFRRSWSTIAASLEIPPYITGRILSHKTSGMSEIDLIYNQHQYVNEMRAAMMKMEDYFKVAFGLVRDKVN